MHVCAHAHAHICFLHYSSKAKLHISKCHIKCNPTGRMSLLIQGSAWQRRKLPTSEIPALGLKQSYEQEKTSGDPNGSYQLLPSPLRKLLSFNVLFKIQWTPPDPTELLPPSLTKHRAQTSKVIYSWNVREESVPAFGKACPLLWSLFFLQCHLLMAIIPLKHKL